MNEADKSKTVSYSSLEAPSPHSQPNKHSIIAYELHMLNSIKYNSLKEEDILG